MAGAAPGSGTAPIPRSRPARRRTPRPAKEPGPSGTRRGPAKTSSARGGRARLQQGGALIYNPRGLRHPSDYNRSRTAGNAKRAQQLGTPSGPNNSEQGPPGLRAEGRCVGGVSQGKGTFARLTRNDDIGASRVERARKHRKVPRPERHRVPESPPSAARAGARRARRPAPPPPRSRGAGRGGPPSESGGWQGRGPGCWRSRGAGRGGPPSGGWRSRRVLGITSNTLVRSSQSSSGPASLPTATGWDEEPRARTASVRLPRPGRSESSFRTDPSVCPVMLRHRYR